MFTGQQRLAVWQHSSVSTAQSDRYAFYNFFHSNSQSIGLKILTRQFQDAIGVAFPGIKVKLTDGDHGEICVKSPFMLTQ